MEFTRSENKIYTTDSSQKVIAEITFPAVDSDTVNIDHTFVDDSLRGQGVAGQLMEAVVDELKEQNKKAIVTCSYAVKWFANHPEHEDLLK